MATQSDTSQDYEFTKMVQSALVVESMDIDGTEIEFNTRTPQSAEIESIDAGPFLEWVAETFSPLEIFPESELIEWAEDNGRTKK